MSQQGRYPLESLAPHQRRIWQNMLQQIEGWEHDRIELPVLTKNLYGLLRASEMDASPIGEGFYLLWTELEGETELRTEPWAPPGAASDERLAEIIAALREYVRKVLAGG